MGSDPMKKMYVNKQRRLFIGRGNYGRKRTVPPSVICIAAAVLLLICAAAYSAFGTYQKRGQARTYLSNARSYTEARNYTAAIEEYNKALKTGGGLNKSDIYRGIIYCYIKEGSTSEAVDYTRMLLARRSLKGDDFKEAALMINSVDPASAYRLLESYLEVNKADEASQQLTAYAASEPEIPQLDMLQGTYVKISDLRFKPNDEHFGHSIYYTTNGSAPDTDSKIYRGGFPLDASTELRAISYNSSGAASEIGLYSFTIDTGMYDKLAELLETAKQLSANTVVGTEIGQCSAPVKSKLDAVISDADELLQRDNILFMDAENRVDYLNAAIEEFDSKKNKNVDKTALENLLVFANDIYTSVAGSAISSSISAELDTLKATLDNAILANSDQASINKAYYSLYSSLLDLNFAGCKAAYKALLVSENSSNYIIYDINGDMIPELILNGGENVMYTYSVSQGKAVRVSDPGSLAFEKFYLHHDGLLACTTSDGSGDFHLITFVANRPVISDKLDEYNTNETLRTSLKPVEVYTAGNTKPIEEFN